MFKQRKAFYIESITKFNTNNTYDYAPVPQNAKWFYELWEKHNLTCIGMKQWSDEKWEVLLKGHKRDLQQFVDSFTLSASKLYTLRETCWIGI